MKETFKKYAAATLITGAATLAMSSAAMADTVDFTDNGISATPSLSEGGVTVTGSDDIQSFGGLGIVGGINSSMVDPGETMTFTFDTPSENVVISSFEFGDADVDSSIDLNATFEAFDENNISLGAISTDFDQNSPFDVSALFVGSSISSFDITMNSDMVRISEISFTEANNGGGAGSYSCEGFGAPFDEDLSIKKKSKKTIPVKIQLSDANGFNVSDADVTTPPVINVIFNGVTYGSGATDDAALDSAGKSNDGNQFRYSVDDQAWIFNLGTKQFSSPGTYEVSVRSGDEGEYTVSATGEQCNQSFTRQP